MSYALVPMYVAVCDRCGAKWENPDAEFVAMGETEGALAVAEDDQWRVQDDGRLFCIDCRLKPGGDIYDDSPEDAEAWRRQHGRRPIVVCLCGSTRFKDTFEEVARTETVAGRIVLTVNEFGNDGHPEKAHLRPVTPDEKARLDELHLRKIDLADEVLILNVGGYIGESTSRELAYARGHGKAVRFLEPEG